jgi:hypothetical protein
MPINFSRLHVGNKQNTIEPRDIFMALPAKDKNYGYPRDVQSEVWKLWFEKRFEKNIIIKMNTGSGKTVVGLAILQSCLNEGKGPVVYVVPDNYLVQQVCAEADRLGIKTTGKEEDYIFTSKKGILVINIHKLVNGKSVFGMRQSGNIQIGSIIVDDVHACLDTIEQQYTVNIPVSHQLYDKIISKIGEPLKSYQEQAYVDIIENQDPRHNILLPFWVWQNNCNEIYQFITDGEYSDEKFVVFNLPLIKDNWKTCNCVISARGIEITPKCISISKITSFAQAERRVYMSATLADDSVFVSGIGLNDSEISNIITPEKANDIGDRLILFPQHLNPKITEEEIKQAIVSKSNECNVVIITPSFERMRFWGNVATQILSARDENIEIGIEKLKRDNKAGLTVFVNKYDGIDLPDDACRILVIDGLPAMRSEYDMVIQEMNPNDTRVCREQIQKIEQGMGRGVRSNSDYCVVVLMGAKLSDALINQDGEKYFSKATHEQYDLSRQLWDQLMESSHAPTIDEIFNLAKYTLQRDTDWVAASKSALSAIEYDRTSNIDSSILARRKAFEKECLEQYTDAFAIIETEKNSTSDNKAKGLLMQLMAEYENFNNQAKAQEILLSARFFNNAVLKPMRGIRYEKLLCPADGQAIRVIKYITENNIFGNNLILRINAILDDLVFSTNSANRFEEALKNISFMIGIHSSRPEKESREGPDNLWALGNSEYLVIECKNGTVTGTISKSDCSQLGSSIQWFENRYAGSGMKCHPIIIHNSNIFEKSSSPLPDTRVIMPIILEKFKNSIRGFVEALTQPEVVCNVDKINALLIQYKLTKNSLLKEYTTSFKKKS